MPDADRPSSPPLWSMNPQGRFSDRAADYAKARPGYPASAIDVIVDDLPPGAHVADIGAGTGIASRLVAERGMTVSAVEPNAEMRAAAAPMHGVRWIAGSAEATNLPAHSAHAVLAAQAFHWFQPAAALKEMRRIIRHDGKLVLMWNARADDDPATHAYIEAIRAAAGAAHPAETRDIRPETFTTGDHFGGFTERVFDYEQRLDRDGLVARALSASYAPKDERVHDLINRLHRVFADHIQADGTIALRYKTRVFVGAPQHASA